jgi:hypothetical protein
MHQTMTAAGDETLLVRKENGCCRIRTRGKRQMGNSHAKRAIVMGRFVVVVMN